MNIGILDVQGAVAPHCEKITELGAVPVRIKNPSQLENIAGIILPGGESTAMIHLLKLNGLWEPLKAFLQQKPALGVCAGTILLATKVSHPDQESLGAMDIDVVRNAYGRQINSFITDTDPTEFWPDSEKVEAVFIRAPIIARADKNVRALLTHEGKMVLAEEGKLLASTFHPELTAFTKVHQYFINKCRG